MNTTDTLSLLRVVLVWGVVRRMVLPNQDRDQTSNRLPQRCRSARPALRLPNKTCPTVSRMSVADSVCWISAAGADGFVCRPNFNVDEALADQAGRSNRRPAVPGQPDVGLDAQRCPGLCQRVGQGPRTQPARFPPRPTSTRAPLCKPPASENSAVSR